MTFCIITHVVHTKKSGRFFAYSPYVNEMDIWAKYADKVLVVAPKEDFETNPIHGFYAHDPIDFIRLEKFNALSVISIARSLFTVPVNCWRIFRAMKKADHIHLRCPGNVGLLGCFVQVLFPKKKKTAKYAGNWDPDAKQPLSYKLQKWILSNTFLTKNMQVLVYGRWPNVTRNIRPFFTATYSEAEKSAVLPRDLGGRIQFIFVGALTRGKQPLYAIRLVEKLRQKGFDVTLSIYGEGPEKEVLLHHISENGLENIITVKGNKEKDFIRKAYSESHFLVLPSKSEGWPKVVAEAMFWGCMPVASTVSCVPFMLDYGNRGILLANDLTEDAAQLEKLIRDPESYNAKAEAAMAWSRQYTTDVFEQEIKQMMQP